MIVGLLALLLVLSSGAIGATTPVAPQVGVEQEVECSPYDERIEELQREYAAISDEENAAFEAWRAARDPIFESDLAPFEKVAKAAPLDEAYFEGKWARLDQQKEVLKQIDELREARTACMTGSEEGVGDRGVPSASGQDREAAGPGVPSVRESAATPMMTDTGDEIGEEREVPVSGGGDGGRPPGEASVPETGDTVIGLPDLSPGEMAGVALIGISALTAGYFTLKGRLGRDGLAGLKSGPVDGPSDLNGSASGSDTSPDGELIAHDHRENARGAVGANWEYADAIDRAVNGDVRNEDSQTYGRYARGSVKTTAGLGSAAVETMPKTKPTHPLRGIWDLVRPWFEAGSGAVEEDKLQREKRGK